MIIMSVRLSDKHTLVVIVHTISIVKKIAKDCHLAYSCHLVSKKAKIDLNIFPHKKNNGKIAILYTALKK